MYMYRCCKNVKCLFIKSFLITRLMLCKNIYKCTQYYISVIKLYKTKPMLARNVFTLVCFFLMCVMSNVISRDNSTIIPRFEPNFRYEMWYYITELVLIVCTPSKFLKIVTVL